MSDLLPARGCVYVANNKGGEGFFAISPPINPGGDKDSPVLIQSVQVTDTDVTLPVTTLGAKRILYTFGRGFGELKVSGIVLLGPGPGSGSKGSVKKVTDWFEKNRVFIKKSPVTVTAPGDVAYKCYFDALNFGAMDPEYHIQEFSLRGWIAEPPAGGSS